MRLKTPLLAAAIAFLATGGVRPLSAQYVQPFAVGGSASALLPSDELGGGQVRGAGITLDFGLSATSALRAEATLHRRASMELGADAGRAYDLAAASLGLRLSAIGRDSDFALLLAPGVQVYSLDASGGDGARTAVLPTLAAGAELRVRVLGPLALSFGARNLMSYTRAGELGSVSGGSRSLRHSPQFSVAGSFLVQRSLPRLPASGATVLPSPVPSATTPVRDHVHCWGPTCPADERERAKVGSVFYESGSDRIHARYQGLLQDVVRMLERDSSATLLIEGYTDPYGGVPLNLSLGERRANGIRELLVRLYGVDEDRVAVLSRGIDHFSRADSVARRADLFVVGTASAPTSTQ